MNLKSRLMMVIILIVTFVFGSTAFAAYTTVDQLEQTFRADGVTYKAKNKVFISDQDGTLIYRVNSTLTAKPDAWAIVNGWVVYVNVTDKKLYMLIDDMARNFSQRLPNEFAARMPYIGAEKDFPDSLTVKDLPNEVYKGEDTIKKEYTVAVSDTKKIVCTVWFSKTLPNNPPLKIDRTLADGTRQVLEFSNWNFAPDNVTPEMFKIPDRDYQPI